MEGKQDYYKVGSRDSIVISSSSLKYINSQEGGSPARFLQFFDELIEEKESRSLRLGTLIHKWAENPDEFHIGTVDKPSDKLGEVADCSQQIIIEKILNKEEFEFPDVVLAACRAIGWNRNYGDDAIKKNACPTVVPYLEDIQKAENEGKIYITTKDKIVIENATASIKKQPLANRLLFMQDTEFTNAVQLKEQEVYWEQKETLFKCKFDDCTINHELKAIFVTELKTMSNSVYQYKNFKHYRTYRQLAFQAKSIREYCFQKDINIADYTWYYNVIGVETNGLYQCVVWRIKQEWITRGELEVRDLVKRIKWHIETDEWIYQKEEIEGDYCLEMPYEEED